MTRFLTTGFLLASLLLSGCSFLGGGDDDDNEPATAGFTEKDFYEVIQRDLSASRWENAITNLEALEAQFPFGDYAEQGQLELIYAHYRSSDEVAAIAAADRFVRLYPQHPNVDYAIYMKGLAAYKQSRGFITSFLPVDVTQRDPGSARESFAAFTELLTRFPDSSYAPDARQRIIYLRNLLARQEIHVANYYFKRGAFLAAANRGRYVVENYQQTPAVPDGLAVMAQGYHLLGMQELSDDAVKLLAINYPDHPSLDSEGSFVYQQDVENEKGILDAITLGLLSTDQQPPNFDSRHIYNPIGSSVPEVEEQDEENSWFDRATFGLFN